MRNTSILADSRDHLRGAGESYFAHLRFAALVGGMLVGAGVACILHSLVPALCTSTASRTVERLTRLFKDRSILPEVAAQSSGTLTMILLLSLALPLATIMLLLSTHLALAGPMALLTLGVPAAYLWSNPALDAVD